MVPGDDLRLKETKVYFYQEYKTYTTGAVQGVFFVVLVGRAFARAVVPSRYFDGQTVAERHYSMHEHLLLSVLLRGTVSEYSVHNFSNDAGHIVKADYTSQHHQKSEPKA